VTELLHWLIDKTPFFSAIVAFFVLNVAMFVGGSLVGEWIYRRFPRARLQPQRAPRAAAREWSIGALTLALNMLVTIAGLWLYRAGYLRLTFHGGWRALVDAALFLLLMDAAMYVLHRIAHWRRFYAVHRMHHDYPTPSALSLFVLHPLETLGFGSLWIALVFVYPFSAWSVVAYTGFNLVYGLIGHLGVELFPRGWVASPLGVLTTTTFHDQHHSAPGHNFGFYTTLWDRLFGTLHPDYQRAFEETAARRAES
jgi:sterol desaturase/sphingolipid hydroxylase (fatty acid hydroxylase superfamily)